MADEPDDDEIAARLGMSGPSSDASPDDDTAVDGRAEPSGPVEVALEQMHTALQGGNWKRAARALRAAIREVGEG